MSQDHRSLAESFREEMSNAFIEMNKAYVRGDMQSHQKLRTDVSICLIPMPLTLPETVA